MGTVSFRALVEALDGKDRAYESAHPVVYTFGGNVRKRDKGADAGIYTYRARMDSTLETFDRDRPGIDMSTS